MASGQILLLCELSLESFCLCFLHCGLLLRTLQSTLCSLIASLLPQLLLPFANLHLACIEDNFTVLESFLFHGHFFFDGLLLSSCIRQVFLLSDLLNIDGKLRLLPLGELFRFLRDVCLLIPLDHVTSALTTVAIH